MGPKKGSGRKAGHDAAMDDKKSFRASAAEDIGKCASGYSKKGSEFIARTVAISGENLTGAQMAAIFGRKCWGKEWRYNSVPHEVYRGFGFPPAPNDLGNMFQFKCDFEE